MNGSAVRQGIGPHQHHTKKCRCGKVISQCRCADINKPIVVGVCADCFAKTEPVHDQRKADVARARSRYDADLGSESHITEADMDHLSGILNDLWDRADAGNTAKLKAMEGERNILSGKLEDAEAALREVGQYADDLHAMGKPGSRDRWVASALFDIIDRALEGGG